ncbi:hypothetical protein ONZ45_g2406 [Pleurotus djamor]|nr:hypothetical protein ONZ45_g2406 [Pleurotus djamor]
MDTLLATVSLLLVLSGFLFFNFRGQHVPPLPPGPPGDPIIDHLRVMPKENQANVFYEWSKTYGDIIYLKVLGRDFIILSSLKAANALLEQRGATYSCRPKIAVFELLGWFPSLTFLPYGPRFRKHRKIYHSAFNKDTAAQYHPIQVEYARTLACSLMENRGDYEHLLRRYATSIVLRITYGYPALPEDDDFMKLIKLFGEIQTHSGPPGGTLIDLFPIFQRLPSWFPGTHYANFARSWSWVIRQLHDMPYDRVKAQRASGMAEPSFVNAQLDQQSEASLTPDDIEDIKSTAATTYAAGADTTWSTITIFILALVLHPEVQWKGQEEVDRVVGLDRLPDFNDYDDLPYVSAMVQEVMRWHPVVPLGVPHRSIGDDIYEGMFIPNGATVFANITALALDENTYSKPLDFNPERFMPRSLGGGEEPPLNAAFGFGRRICPGRHVATASVWIAVATILATLDVSRAKDELGNEIIPPREFNVGITSTHPPLYRGNVIIDMGLLLQFAVLGFVLYVGVYLIKRRRVARMLPPGPPGEPLIGHLRILPSTDQGRVYYEWSKQYGDVMHLKVLNQNIIILNSVKAASELLDKRGALYSDRPRFIVFEMLGWTRDLGFFGYGEDFRKHRKLFHSYFRQEACYQFQQVQLESTHILIRELLKNEGRHDFLLNRYATSVLLRIAYGHKILSDDDEILSLVHKLGSVQEQTGPPGGTALDLFPFLRYFPSWFPGTHYANFARQWNWLVRDLHDVPFKHVTAQLASGTAEPSFVAQQLEQTELPLSDRDMEDIKGVAAVIYAAGADSTWSSLVTFILAIVLNPEVQKKGQEEIDRVVGSDRLPTFDDYDALPYTHAVVQEVLRWHPVTPLGIPHRSTVDDTYKGMFIPKGSIIFGNAAFILIAFFLDLREGMKNHLYKLRLDLAVGRHLATDTIWIVVANIFASMTISKAKDKAGNEVTPPLEFVTGISR